MGHNFWVEADLKLGARFIFLKELLREYCVGQILVPDVLLVHFKVGPQKWQGVVSYLQVVELTTLLVDVV